MDLVNRYTVPALLLDLVYCTVALVTAPWWMRKARGGWAERFGRTPTLPDPAPNKKRLLVHAVSVGEVNATRPLADALGEDIDIVLSVTTDTGIARARELYTDRFPVVRYPLDASWSVRRFLNAVRPHGVALVELELWPNFLDTCARRSIPVAVVNGRLSARSFKGYRRMRWFLGKLFARLAHAGVQDEAYRDRFVEMGVAPDRCTVVGNTKWDAPAPDTSGAELLAREMGIDRNRPLVVAGSTAPGEDALLRALLPPEVQLLCAPRRPEWREEAERALDPCVKRTKPNVGDPNDGRFLLDTLGELAMAYALADVVVVGRSFGDLHGSDPMEPAVLGKPALIGPRFGDFEKAVELLREEGALLVTDAERLGEDLARVLEDADVQDRMARSARDAVAKHRGASLRYAAIVRSMLGLPENPTDHGAPDAGA